MPAGVHTFTKRFECSNVPAISQEGEKKRERGDPGPERERERELKVEGA